MRSLGSGIIPRGCLMPVLQGGHFPTKFLKCLTNSTINNVLRQVVCEHKLMKNYKDFLLKVYINCMISYGTIFWFAVKTSLFRVTFKIHVAIHLELAQNALQKPFSMSCMLLTCVSVKNHSFDGLMNSINWPASSVWVFIGQAGRALQR